MPVEGISLAERLMHEVEYIIRRARRTFPVRIKMELPLITRKGMKVNFELKNDTVATITIHAVDAAGDVVPAPAGDVFSVASSDSTKLQADIGADLSGNPAVILTPLV